MPDEVHEGLIVAFLDDVMQRRGLAATFHAEVEKLEPCHASSYELRSAYKVRILHEGSMALYVVRVRKLESLDLAFLDCNKHW